MPIEPVTPPKEKDAPPKSERPRRAAPGSAKLREGLTDLYVTIGAVAVTPLDRLAGALLIADAEEIAGEWVALAEKDPAVRKALEKLIQAGGWGSVIMAHGLILLPVLANRGMFPDQVAAGTAVMTVARHKDVAPLFTHERFRQAAPPEQASGNGSRN